MGFSPGTIATADWPEAALWRLRAAKHPEAVELLSPRGDPATCCAVPEPRSCR
jgi:hypothetical protein